MERIYARTGHCFYTKLLWWVISYWNTAFALHWIKFQSVNRMRLDTVSKSWCWCNDMKKNIKWSLSRKARNSFIHAINGNPKVKKKGKNRSKNFATSSFAIGDRSKISKDLSKH